MNSIVDLVLTQLKRHQNLSSTQLATVKYGLEYTISFLLSFILTLFIGIILDNTKIIIVMMLANALFRFFSGGYHMKKMVHCSIFGAIMLNLMGVLVKLWEISNASFYIFILPVLIFMPMSIYFLVPVDGSNAPIKPNKISRYKRFSLGIFIFWLLMLFPWKYNLISNDIVFGISAGFLWQIFMLTPLSNKLILSIERRIL